MRFERAARATVVEFYRINLGSVERNRLFLLRLLQQVFLLDEQELRLRIDEPPNQLGTRHAINFDVFPCNPFHINLTVARNM